MRLYAKRMNVRLETDAAEALEALAAKSGISQNDVINDALRKANAPPNLLADGELLSKREVAFLSTVSGLVRSTLKESLSNPVIADVLARSVARAIETHVGR